MPRTLPPKTPPAPCAARGQPRSSEGSESVLPGNENETSRIRAGQEFGPQNSDNRKGIATPLSLPASFRLFYTENLAEDSARRNQCKRPRSCCFSLSLKKDSSAN
ncbi:UNVERIFIED_CONTAM: hypothetical protein K2H54_004759 [Gekko kuhli]